MIEQLRLEDFSGRVGEKFRLTTTAGDTVEIELLDAAGSNAPPLQRQPFSLVFRLPAEVPPIQAIYHLEHDEMGAMDLFLVPLGPGKEGLQWEAVFT